jgi:hypothetical protein
LKFEQKVADEVAKAGFRQKPGPKKGSIRNRVPKITGRAKTKHSDWNVECTRKFGAEKSESNGATVEAQERRQR